MATVRTYLYFIYFYILCGLMIFVWEKFYVRPKSSYSTLIQVFRDLCPVTVYYFMNKLNCFTFKLFFRRFQTKIALIQRQI